MTVSAHEVSAVLRERLPGLPTKKLHKLLYYCQGHHLASFGEPLFHETISAWDMGPVVGTLWYQERQGGAPASSVELDEAHLNTIGYVLSRYGALSGLDLEHLTHSETPWKAANQGRPPGTSKAIKPEVIREYFLTADTDDGDAGALVPDADALAQLLSRAEERRQAEPRPDSMERLRARLSVR